MKGEIVATRSYGSGNNISDTRMLLLQKSPALYYVNIMCDGIEKTRKLRIK